MRQPLLARNRPFSDTPTPSCPVFGLLWTCPCSIWPRRPFLARNRPFLDTRTLACPVFGRADPFLPHFVPFCPFLYIRTPFCPLFGHADHFLPNIVPFWTHEPLSALFLAVLTTSCPLIVPFWMSEPFHALFLDVLIILLLELSPFGYMVGCADPFLTWHCPHPGCYGLF